MNNEPANEQTALLHGKSKRKPTPLPKGQITILLLLQICEPITSQSIYPYINELVSGLDIVGGDERKVGFYSGLIESLFFATEAITVLHWSLASDHFGRKNIFLIGLGGTILSMLCFGFSRTFWGLVVSRCLTGLLNGNVGVMKSAVGDLTDSTNRAEGVALLPVVWATGVTLGPLIGGSLARPHDRFPNVFRSAFWEEYPYLLPCIVTSGYVLMCFFITLFYFKECAPIKIRKNKSKLNADAAEEATLYSENTSGPLPLREILTYPVVLSVSNYVTLAFLNIAYNALFPLFCAMPLHIGGLALPPSTIGYILGGYGILNGLIQFFFFAKIMRSFGERRVFLCGMSAFVPLFAMLPVINFIARRICDDGHVSAVIWPLIGVLLVLQVAMDMAYGAVFMYVTASAPNKESLGATNGLSQTVVSIARAIGPAMASSLFSLSVERNILNGYGVYLLFILLSFGALTVARRLPEKIWDDVDEDDI